MTPYSRSLIDGCGYIAAFCTTIAFVPQLVRVLQLRSARDISLGMVLIFTFGVVMWLVYGIMLHSWPIIIANTATLVLSLGLLVLKVHFSGRERRTAVRRPDRAK